MLPPSSFSDRAYLVSKEEVAKTLRVRLDQGLTNREAKKRQGVYGFNEFSASSTLHPVTLFFSRFRDPLVLILVAAAVISLLLHNGGDAVVITAVLIIDALLSFTQVWRTEQTLEKVRRSIVESAYVFRDASLKKIPTRELVVGDIIELQAGGRVPADARVIMSHGLATQEATLTGEATDINKHATRLTSRAPLAQRANMIFMGTSVVNGSGRAIVTATGTRTEYGKIGQLLRAPRIVSSPLKRLLDKASWQAGVGILIAVVVLMFFHLVIGKSIVDAIQIALTLFVSAIPENLTMVLTVALAVSVSRILKRGGVVRQLTSVETLGAVTVICADKTGTLTKAEMTAVHLDFLQGTIIDQDYPPREYMQELALIGFALASDAHPASAKATAGKPVEYIGSTAERAALAFTESFGLSQKKLRDQWRQRDGISFSPQWKYRATLHDHPQQDTRTLFVTGAPDILLERSSYTLDRNGVPTELTAKKRVRLLEKMRTRSARGTMLVAVAMRRAFVGTSITHDDIHGLTFMGVLLVLDPIRSDVRASVSEALQAGIAVKLITGDHESTAQAVARAIGLTVTIDTVCTGAELESLSDEELQAIVYHTVVFSRVTPLGKQRIIRALQKTGQIVAMTGDGVNDAVALKTADVGVAMGSGKDIAKDAASLVLLTNSFATIVDAIREGRTVRANIRKVIGFLLATNSAEVLLFIVSLLCGLPIPLSAAQLLWINLVTDATTDVALALEPEEGDVMHRKPEHPDAPLFNRTAWAHILFSGAVMTAASLLLYWYTFIHLAFDEDYAHTMVFTFMALTSVLSVWSWRSLTRSMYGMKMGENPWLILSTSFSFLLQLAAIYVPLLQDFFKTVPLYADDWVLLFIFSIATIIIIDARKLWPQLAKLVAAVKKSPATI